MNFRKYIFSYILTIFSLAVLVLMLLAVDTPFRIFIIGLFIFAFLLAFINKKVHEEKQSNNEYSKLDEDTSSAEKFKKYWKYAFYKPLSMPKWIKKFWEILMFIATILSVILFIIKLFV